MTDFRLFLLLALAALCHSAPNYQQREPLDANFLGAGVSGSNNFRSYQIGLGGGSNTLQQTEPPCDDDKTLQTGSQSSRTYSQSQRQVGSSNQGRNVGGSYVQHNPTIGQSHSQSYTQSQRKVDVFEDQPSFVTGSHSSRNLHLGQARSQDDLSENHLNDEQSRLVVSSQVLPGQVSRSQTSSSYSQTQQKVNVFEDEPSFVTGSHSARTVGSSYARPNPSAGEISSHSSRTSSSTQQKVNVFDEEPSFLTELQTSRLPKPSHLQAIPAGGESNSHVTRTSSSYSQTQQKVNAFEDQPSFVTGSQPSRYVGSSHSRPNPSLDQTSSHSSRVSSTQQKVNVFEEPYFQSELQTSRVPKPSHLQEIPAGGESNSHASRTSSSYSQTQQKVNVFEDQPSFATGSHGSQNLALGSVQHPDTSSQTPRNVGHSHNQSPSIGGSSSQTYRSSRVSTQTQRQVDGVGDRPSYGTGSQPNRYVSNAHITLNPTAEEMTSQSSRSSVYSQTQQKVDVFDSQPASHTSVHVPSHIRQPSVRDSTLESSRVYDQSQQKVDVFTDHQPISTGSRVPGRTSRPVDVVFEEQSSYRSTGVRGDTGHGKPARGQTQQQVDSFDGHNSFGQSGSQTSRTYGSNSNTRVQPVVTSFREQHSYSRQTGTGSNGQDLGLSNQQTSTGSQSHRSYGQTSAQVQPIVYTYTQQSGAPGSRAQGLTQQQEDVFSQQSVGSTGSRGYGQNHRLVELSGNEQTSGTGSDGLQVARTGSQGQGSYHRSYSTSGRTYSQADTDPLFGAATADHDQQFQDLVARMGQGLGSHDVTGSSITPGGKTFSTFQSRSWGSSNINGNCTSHGKTTKVTNNNGVVDRVTIEDTPNSNC